MIERRKQLDRRTADRQGKYDRRRNRCLHCLQFQGDQGFCLFYQKAVGAMDFACPSFQGIQPERR